MYVQFWLMVLPDVEVVKTQQTPNLKCAHPSSVWERILPLVKTAQSSHDSHHDSAIIT
jgi:hypothetical protein